MKVFGNRRGGGGGGGGGRGGGGGLAPFSLGPQTDPRNSTMVILSANQGGLILNREDYLDSNDRATRRRQQYVDHVTRSLHLIGESDSQAKADADSIPSLETRLAKTTIPQADVRDPNATYHKMTLAELGTMTPHIDWTRYLDQQGAKTVADVNVRTPTFFAALDSLIPAVPIDTWKAYLRWHATNGAMASLGTPFRTEAFRWQQITSGVQQPEPRLKQCAAATNAALGGAVWEGWVKRNFTPPAKARAARMVDNLVSALRDRIRQLDWMSDPTKQQAVARGGRVERGAGLGARGEGAGPHGVEHEAAYRQRVVQRVTQSDPVPRRHSAAAVLRS